MLQVAPSVPLDARKAEPTLERSPSLTTNVGSSGPACGTALSTLSGQSHFLKAADQRSNSTAEGSPLERMVGAIVPASGLKMSGKGGDIPPGSVRCTC